MTNEEKGKMLPDKRGAYPFGYVPDGPLQRGALYRTENNRIRMYPPGTSKYYQKKARKRWEAERMEIYEEHKFDWLASFLSDTELPYINDSLKFHHRPDSDTRYIRNEKSWTWVYDKFKDDQEIINKVKSEKNADPIKYLVKMYTQHFRTW